jgi:hypothetical protein
MSRLVYFLLIWNTFSGYDTFTLPTTFLLFLASNCLRRCLWSAALCFAYSLFSSLLLSTFCTVCPDYFEVFLSHHPSFAVLSGLLQNI